MTIIFSTNVLNKLTNKTPPVTEREVLQCFVNQTHVPLIDSREEHLTAPLTRWFVAETDLGRKLKVIYVPRPDGIYIKSAYDANAKVCCIYSRLARPLFGVT